MQAECENTLPALSDCEAQFCEAPCEESSGGSSSSGSSSGGVSSGGGSSSGSSGGPPPTCLVDATIACSPGATGFTCIDSYDPQTGDPALSCTTPTEANGELDYCCFPGTWSSSTCMPYVDLAVCPQANTYGYQCESNENPSILAPALSCSSPSLDADGVHADYCCTLN
jgi:hypothetical protein